MKISLITRHDLIDAISAEKIDWSGRLEEAQFLSRLFDLSSMPSRDNRFPDAGGDIWQHRVNNYDWDDDWVFHDSRFNLMNCDDEIFLRFLCETVHPVVRPDVAEAEKIRQTYDVYLKNDGFQLVERTRLSGKPVYAGRYVGTSAMPGISAARETLSGTDATYVTQQITRMETAVLQDPNLAIGTAKELVETCCRTILSECSIDIPKKTDLPQLVKLTCKQLALTPQDIPDDAKASETIKRLLSNLATITQGVAELRNSYGTGHGKHSSAKGLTTRHAKLAVGAASTLAVFLAETHKSR